jgi:DNA-binding NarL/FixJ family response regulator
MDDLRILIADDHAVLRDGLKALVNAQPDMKVIGEAENGRIALQRTRELLPDVVIMDVSMPEMNGAQATQRLKQMYPTIKVLALTAYEDKAYLRHLMGSGASGFLLKRAATDELIQAIRIIAKGGAYIDPTLAGKVLGSFIRQPASKTGTPRSELSDREAEVLRLIAWGYSNKEIANDLDISVKTVETYKARFAEKLDLHSRTAIVRYAVRQGWMQEAS